MFQYQPMNTTDFNQTISSWVAHVIMLKKDGLKNDPLEKARFERYLQSKDIHSRKLSDNGSTDLEVNASSENPSSEKEGAEKNSGDLERIYIESLVDSVLKEKKATIDSGLEKLESTVTALNSAALKNNDKIHEDIEVPCEKRHEQVKRTGISKARALQLKSSLKNLKETFTAFKRQTIDLLAGEKLKLTESMGKQLAVGIKKILSSRKKIVVEEIKKAHITRMKEKKDGVRENMISGLQAEEKEERLVEPEVGKRVKKEILKVCESKMELETRKESGKREVSQQLSLKTQEAPKNKPRVERQAENSLENSKFQPNISKGFQEKSKNQQKASRQKNDESQSSSSKQISPEIAMKGYNLFVRDVDSAVALGQEIVRDLIRVVREIEAKQGQSNQVSKALGWSVTAMESELLQRHAKNQSKEIRLCNDKALKNTADSNISEHSGSNITTPPSNNGDYNAVAVAALQSKGLIIPNSMNPQKELSTQLNQMGMKSSNNLGANYFEISNSFNPDSAFYSKMADPMLDPRLMNQEAMLRAAAAANTMNLPAYDLYGMGMYEMVGRMNAMNQPRNPSLLQYF